MAVSENSTEDENRGHKLELEHDFYRCETDVQLPDHIATRIMRAVYGLNGLVDVLRMDEAKNSLARDADYPFPGPLLPVQRDFLWSAAKALTDELDREMERWRK